MEGKSVGSNVNKRFGDINELNGAVEFLCSDVAALFITGALLAVDGEFSAFSGVSCFYLWSTFFEI
jgi:NAD(P)-dependent dehydrogenase (short-subunit alcohol dehydrogenase family)